MVRVRNGPPAARRAAGVGEPIFSPSSGVKIGGTALLDAGQWRPSCLEFCESFYFVGQRSGCPKHGCCLPGRCEGFAPLSVGPKAVTGGGKKRASRAMMASVPIDKKEGHPAVRPDTLLVDAIGAGPAQNGGSSSPLTVPHAVRFIAGRSACAAALVRAAGTSFCVEASRTMWRGMRASRSRSARFAWVPPPLHTTASTGLKASMRALR